MSDAVQALIVDDDEHLRSLLELGVEQMGFKAHAVANTLLAKDWLESNLPKLIVLDIMMPDGNGLDLCRWIRKQPRLAKIPILISSALKDDETAQDALEMGAVDFLHKPFTMQALREKLERIQRL